MRNIFTLFLIICISLSTFIISKIHAQESAYDFFLIGKNMYDAQNYKQAIHNFDKAISLNTFYYDAYLEKAKCYLAINNKSEALNEINKVINLKRNYAPALYMRAEYWMNEKQYKQAITDLKEVVLQNKYYYPARELLANAYYNINDFQNALNEINFLISEQPTEYKYLLKRAHINKDMKQWNEAIKDCNTLISKNKFANEAYALRGTILLEQNKNNEAFDDFSRAIANNYFTKELLLIYLNMSMKNDKLINSQQALELLIKNYEPKNSYYHLLLGKILIKEQKYDIAISVLKNAISLRPNYDTAYVYLGMAKRLISKDPINDLRKAIYLNPKNSLAYEELGIYYIDKKLYSQALDNLITAIKLNPTGRAYYYRAIVWDLNRNKENACLDLKKAKELNYKEAQIAFNKICM